MAAKQYLVFAVADAGVVQGAQCVLNYDDTTLVVSSIQATVAGTDSQGNVARITVQAQDSSNDLNFQQDATSNPDGTSQVTTWDISSYGSKFPSGTTTYKGHTVPNWGTTTLQVSCNTSSF